MSYGVYSVYYGRWELCMAFSDKMVHSAETLEDEFAISYMREVFQARVKIAFDIALDLSKSKIGEFTFHRNRTANYKDHLKERIFDVTETR